MASARLLSLTLERFKSYRDRTVIPLHPLTVIVGRNNSGKSTIIQALLLLKQTLELPRPEVPLHLEGYVDALSLRELTYGWPEEGESVQGPTIGIRWRPNSRHRANFFLFSDVDQDRDVEAKSWMEKSDGLDFFAEIKFGFDENGSYVDSLRIDTIDTCHGKSVASLFFARDKHQKCCLKSALLGEEFYEADLTVELHHFLPVRFDAPNKSPVKNRNAVSLFFALLPPLNVAFG